MWNFLNILEEADIFVVFSIIVQYSSEGTEDYSCC